MERGFKIFLLESLSKFRFGINAYDFMGYIQYYYPYYFDPADPFEGFSKYLFNLNEDGLIDGGLEKTFITEKGKNLVKEFNKKYYSYDIINFFHQCVKNSSPVASIDKILDSQTQKILELIFSRISEPSVLDYGCGKMRLLNALISFHNKKNWRYFGIDTINPKSKYILEYMHLEKSESWSTGTIEELRKQEEKFDFVIMMNVLHELSIIDMANAIEDARQHLSDSGFLIIVDTTFVIEGEPRFVPIFPWEIEAIFEKFENHSYTSKSGVPIAFYVICKDGIPIFDDLPHKIEKLVTKKRDLLSRVSTNLKSESSADLIQALGLGINDSFDYGYINTIIANANARLVEFDAVILTDDINLCAINFFSWAMQLHSERGFFPSLDDIYVNLSKEFSYLAISDLLKALTSYPPVFTIRSSKDPITAYELLDIIVGEIGIDAIRKDGIRLVFAKATALHKERFN